MRSSIGAICLAIAFASSTMATPVDLELSLLIDSSGSINSSEFSLQMNGYANAFRDSATQTAILGGSEGSIAVNVVFFSSSAVEGIPFTLLDSVTAINAFADSLATTSRPFNGSTDVSGGLRLAASTFGSETGSNGSGQAFTSARQVIDISGDGVDNVGSRTGPRAVRDAALAAGVDAINGLAIEGSANSTTITDYYQDTVIGGNGSFVETVVGFDTFEDAIGRKIRREVAPNPTPTPGPVPEPTSIIAWLGLGLCCLARRRWQSIQ